MPLSPQVQEGLANGPANVFVKFQPANVQIPDNASPAEKKQLVFEQKKAAAEAAQHNVVQLLQAQGVTFKSFYLDNAVLVTAVTSALAHQIAALPEVVSVELSVDNAHVH